MTPQAMREGLVKALERSGEGFTIEDLEADLAAHRALLWTGEDCAVVTTLQDGPEGRCLHVWLGTGSLMEMGSLEPGIAAHARALGCTSATINGRPGWDRVFAGRGFVRDGEELRKAL